MNNPIYTMLFWLMIIGQALAVLVIVTVGLLMIVRSLGHPFLVTFMLWTGGGSLMFMARLVVLDIKYKLQDAGYIKQDNE